MAGVDDNYDGEVIRMPGIRVGFLEQEPRLPEGKSVREAVEESLGETAAAKKRLDEVYAAYSEPDADFDKLAEEQARLEAIINAGGADELEVAADALRLPPWEQRVDVPLGRGEAPRGALPAALVQAGPAPAGRADQPPRRRERGMAGAVPAALSGNRGGGAPTTATSSTTPAGWILELDRGYGIPWEGNYSSWLEPEEKAAAARGEPGSRAHQGDAGRARMGAPEPERPPGKVQGEARALRRTVAVRASAKERDPGDLHPGGRAPRATR
jgi:sulfate-transporting ATPase